MKGLNHIELNGNMCGGIFKCENFMEMESSKSGWSLGEWQFSKLRWNVLVFSSEPMTWDFQWFISHACEEGYITPSSFSSSTLVGFANGFEQLQVHLTFPPVPKLYVFHPSSLPKPLLWVSNSIRFLMNNWGFPLELGRVEIFFDLLFSCLSKVCTKQEWVTLIGGI
jgi:hypothetical protein